MNFKVIKKFRDRNTKAVHNIDTVLALADERAAEINAAAGGPYVETLPDPGPVTPPPAEPETPPDPEPIIPPAGGNGNDPGGCDDELSDIRKLDKTGLQMRAAELGLDISACKNNTERADMIIAALKKASDAGSGIEGGGGSDGGG